MSIVCSDVFMYDFFWEFLESTCVSTEQASWCFMQIFSAFWAFNYLHCLIPPAANSFDIESTLPCISAAFVSSSIISFICKLALKEVETIVLLVLLLLVQLLFILSAFCLTSPAHLSLCLRASSELAAFLFAVSSSTFAFVFTIPTIRPMIAPPITQKSNT